MSSSSLQKPEAVLRIDLRRKSITELRLMWQALKDEEQSLLKSMVREVLFERGASLNAS